MSNSKKNKNGYVYLLGDWGKEGTYKIGVTTGSIENRIKKLQTGNSGEIYIVNYYQTKYPFFLEKWLHRKFFKENIKNEWFELDSEQVFSFKDECKKIEDMIEVMKDNPFFKIKG